jgi:hypothetical protein
MSGYQVSASSLLPVDVSSKTKDVKENREKLAPQEVDVARVKRRRAGTLEEDEKRAP